MYYGNRIGPCGVVCYGVEKDNQNFVRSRYDNIARAHLQGAEFPEGQLYRVGQDHLTVVRVISKVGEGHSNGQ